MPILLFAVAGILLMGVAHPHNTRLTHAAPVTVAHVIAKH